jgi:hypothetical protein
VIVCVPAAVGVKLAEHVEVGMVPGVRVQLVGVPPPLDENCTVPVGWAAVPEISVSVTVAWHVVAVPTCKVEGEQLTLPVVVAWMAASCWASGSVTPLKAVALAPALVARANAVVVAEPQLGEHVV